MEEFFEKLKTDKKRPESDIEKVKKVFTEQAILFDNLMETGELAMTDATLKEIGIAQLDLRIAILSVIRAINHEIYWNPMAQTAGEIKQVYSRSSSLTEGLVIKALFSYKDKSIFLNTQPLLDWTLLCQKLKEVFQIAENSVINLYRKLDDGTLCQIIDISGIEEKVRYYVQTDTGIFCI